MISNQKLNKTAFSELSRILAQVQSMRAVANLGPRRVEWAVDCRVVGDAEMIRLNKTYRNQAKVTDVLSFSSGEPFFGQGFLGTLVICDSVLEKQAKEEGHSARDELRVLLVHGILHLLGFDHERGPKDAEIMRRYEALLLKKVARPVALAESKVKKQKKARKAAARGLIERARSGKR